MTEDFRDQGDQAGWDLLQSVETRGEGFSVGRVFGRGSRSRAPLGIAAFLAIPLFFSSLMASTLAQEKPVKIQWQGCASGICTVWHDPSSATVARIWLWALVPSLLLVAVGWIATRLPLGFYISCLAAIVLSMAVVHKTGTWAKHHTARFPVGVDLIPPQNTISDQWSRGQWEKDAVATALSLQHWTIGVALAAMLVMAFLWLRSRRKRPDYATEPAPAAFTGEPEASPVVDLELGDSQLARWSRLGRRRSR